MLESSTFRLNGRPAAQVPLWLRMGETVFHTDTQTEVFYPDAMWDAFSDRFLSNDPHRVDHISVNRVENVGRRVTYYH